jgi:Ca2+-binding EF-hand superfamily protein
MDDIKLAFKDANMNEAEIETLFKDIDYCHHGEINYSKFLTICVDRRKVISRQNLLFAFHHFEESTKGFITTESLIECFKREGKLLKQEEVTEIMKDVQHKDKT